MDIKEYWFGGGFDTDGLTERLRNAVVDIGVLLYDLEVAQSEVERFREVLEVYAHESSWSSCAFTEMETGEYPDVNGNTNTRTVEMDLGIDTVWCNNDDGALYAQQALGLKK